MANTVTDHDALDLEFTAAFLKGLQATETAVLWPQIAQLVPVKTESFVTPIAGMLPNFREWIGERQFHSLKRDLYTVTVKKYEGSASCPRDAFDDDTTGAYKVQWETMGYRGRVWPDVQVFAALKNGHNSKCFDGQNFFSATHPVEHGNASAGTWSNMTGSGGVDPWYILDTSQPVKPLIWALRRAPEIVNIFDPRAEHVAKHDEYLGLASARGVADYGMPHMAFRHAGALDGTNFDAAMTSISSLVNEYGDNYGFSGKLLVVSEKNRVTARKLFGQDILASGESNTHKDAINWIVSPYL